MKVPRFSARFSDCWRCMCCGVESGFVSRVLRLLISSTQAGGDKVEGEAPANGEEAPEEEEDKSISLEDYLNQKVCQSRFVAVASLFCRNLCVPFVCQGSSTKTPPPPKIRQAGEGDEGNNYKKADNVLTRTVRNRPLDSPQCYRD